MSALTQIQQANLPAIGGTFEGGFYAGQIRINTDVFALIVAPKAQGEHDDIEWGEYGKKIEGAGSVFDGLANTIAMVEAGSALGKWARELSIDGHTDWYLPARDELEVIYRNLKPTTRENWTYRSGENVSAVPPTYAYTEQTPTQTAVVEFQEGNADAFDAAWYWTSSQYSAYDAWCQNFVDGDQSINDKEDGELRARAVRRLLVIQ